MNRALSSFSSAVEVGVDHLVGGFALGGLLGAGSEIGNPPASDEAAESWSHSRRVMGEASRGAMGGWATV